MKNEKSAFTAREVVEILQRAKELGIRSLKLEGFEAEFDLKPAAVSVKPVQSTNSQPMRQDNCTVCGAEKIMGHWGHTYCRPCHLQRKEAKWKETRRW